MGIQHGSLISLYTCLPVVSPCSQQTLKTNVEGAATPTLRPLLRFHPFTTASHRVLCSLLISNTSLTHNHHHTFHSLPTTIMSANESGWTEAPKRGWKAWKAPNQRNEYVPPPAPQPRQQKSSSFMAEAGSSAPQLVGILYKNFTPQQRSVNFEWRRSNNKCTSCGMSGHFKPTCPVWLKIKNEVRTHSSGNVILYANIL
jgi:hypothetical protein